jgi:hypothetical protein
VVLVYWGVGSGRRVDRGSKMQRPSRVTEFKEEK